MNKAHDPFIQVVLNRVHLEVDRSLSTHFSTRWGKHGEHGDASIDHHQHQSPFVMSLHSIMMTAQSYKIEARSLHHHTSNPVRILAHVPISLLTSMFSTPMAYSTGMTTSKCLSANNTTPQERQQVSAPQSLSPCKHVPLHR